ncbi:MAG: ammonia channel protein, partial [Cyclobacteriaceae bacterium]|nr:ammonia channel protein [Cyclobacteriaceae bacterium]
IALGIAASAVCYYALLWKEKLGFDDTLDAFGIHGVGGIVGAILLTFFIRDSWMEEAAVAAGGSWTVWQQLGVQVAAVLIAIAYAGAMTYILLIIVNKTVGLRSSKEGELKGLDDYYHGERGYGMVSP